MSRFYGTVDGASKTQATRRGHGSLTTHAASWHGAVKVDVWLGDDGKEHYSVELVPWKGTGKKALIATGTFGADEYQLGNSGQMIGLL